MDKILKKQVKEFMTKKVVSAKKEDSIKEIFKLMDKKEILGLPVIDELERPIGMVTETDLIKHFTTLEFPSGINLLGSMVFLGSNSYNETLKDHCAETAADIMTEGTAAIIEDATLLEAIDMMSKYHINRLPVVDGKEKLVGIITRTDIIHQLAKSKNI